METRKPRVLLIGETGRSSSYLAKHLEKRGCECSFAVSYRESSLLLRQQDFDLVLSPMRLRDGNAFSLIDQLDGSRTTFFFSYAVERGCWWLPALRSGQQCFGSTALRHREFFDVLEEIIKEIRFAPPVTIESSSRPAPLAGLRHGLEKGQIVRSSPPKVIKNSLIDNPFPYTCSEGAEFADPEGMSSPQAAR